MAKVAIVTGAGTGGERAAALALMQAGYSVGRAGRLADGWFPMMQPGPELDEAKAVVDSAARDAGRDPSRIGMEGRVRWQRDRDGVVAAIEGWAARGATHVSVDTMRAGLTTVDDHLAVLESVAVGVGLRTR